MAYFLNLLSPNVQTIHKLSLTFPRHVEQWSDDRISEFGRHFLCPSNGLTKGYVPSTMLFSLAWQGEPSSVSGLTQESHKDLKWCYMLPWYHLGTWCPMKNLRSFVLPRVKVCTNPFILKYIFLSFSLSCYSLDPS